MSHKIPNGYRNNHYVPIWYQERFVDPNRKDNKFFYLDKSPEIFTDSGNHIYYGKAVRGIEPGGSCFQEEDLYTSFLGEEKSTGIERLFFGQVDSNGKKAIEYWTNFMHPSKNTKAFHDLLLYMSTQKFRTPKGLQWLAEQLDTDDRNLILRKMIELKQQYSAIWTECIWLIADATQSNTKFIVSDHPVTVYNRRCGPKSQWCREANDPDIRFHASHTLFPLSLDKILILTNLSWVRNPYQKETGIRPNPGFARDAMFHINQIQIFRHLSEQEVREINFIIKARAFRYIAAGKEEWLYPENYISKSDWHNYGYGYLLMPDPRSVVYSGEVMWGNKSGPISAIDAYGRRPGDPDFNKEVDEGKEYEIFHSFKGEFARRFGRYRRGRSFNNYVLDEEKDDEKMHKFYLSLEKKKRK